MGTLTRGVRFILGFFLYHLNRRTIDLHSLLRGKRVAIIGAANSAFHTGKGSYIDGFDVVIRINKATLLLKESKWDQDIGRKTDILFHSFFENEKSGGGPLDFPWFDKLGIQYVVNPVAAYEGYRVTFNFYKKYLHWRKTYRLSMPMYRTIQAPLGSLRPTIGYCALMAVLDCDIQELYITGFTFFRTPFGDGYRDAIREVSQVRQLIKDEGHHDPDLELAAFAKKWKESSNKNIRMDDALMSILSNFRNGSVS